MGKKVAFYVIIGIALSLVLLPIVWLVLTSFKTKADIFAVPPQWLPSKIVLKNYTEQFTEGPVFRVFINSVVIAVVTVVSVIIIATPAAYIFARYRFRGELPILILILVMRMIPVISIVIPLFIVFSRLGLLDTCVALIIIQIACKIPLAIWILKGFFSTIPKEIEECAMLDGCSLGGVLTRIILPLAKPGIAASAVIAFIYTWNDLLITLAISATVASRTLPVQLTQFVMEFRVVWERMCALGVIMLIPAVVFVFLAEKGLLKGLLLGSMKE